jgi:hypothetical protein
VDEKDGIDAGWHWGADSLGQFVGKTIDPGLL